LRRPISKYRMGWMMVLFDLPTDTKEERRVATRFRNDLLDQGYLMLQYSVYARCAVVLEKKKTLLNQLKDVAPETGNVQCLFFTDAQWEQCVTITRSATKLRRQIDKKDQIGEQLQFW